VGENAMTDRFLLIFVSEVTVTVLCGVLLGVIAIFGPNPQSAAIAASFETLRILFAAGVSSIFALLGAYFRPSGKL
jgi:ABC-type polysaccharide/polyol phosphate export permease